MVILSPEIRNADERRDSRERSRKDKDRHRSHRRKDSRSPSRRHSRRHSSSRNKPKKGVRSRGTSRDRSSEKSRKRERSRSRNRSAFREVTTSNAAKQLKPNMEAKPIAKEDIQESAEIGDEMMKMMGFSTFDTTKGKHVPGNNASAVRIIPKSRCRQYMNRKGGFNKPLDDQ